MCKVWKMMPHEEVTPEQLVPKKNLFNKDCSKYEKQIADYRIAAAVCLLIGFVLSNVSASLFGVALVLHHIAIEQTLCRRWLYSGD